MLLRKTIYNKYFYILLILILIPILYFFDKSTRWSKESRQYTDEFLNLLSTANYNELYSKYAMNSGMDFRTFVSKIDMLNQKFGKIRSYSYAGSNLSYSGNPRVLTGLFIHYRLTSENVKYYQGTFSMHIDEETNLPIIGNIEEFSVIGRDIKTEDFLLRLIGY